MLTIRQMEKEDKLKNEINIILEMIYWLYQKELKEGNFKKEKFLPSFGKILKRKNPFKNNGGETLFGYIK